jgi:hypothetical protein
MAAANALLARAAAYPVISSGSNHRDSLAPLRRRPVRLQAGSL